jgi:hypothetical protein
MNRIVLSLLISTIIVGCSNSLDAVSTPTELPSPVVTSTEMLLPTSSPTITSIDTLPIITKRYCPAQREVPFEELDINASYLLILRDIESEMLLTASKSLPEQHVIPNISPNAVLFRGVEISPDGQWFAYLVLEENQNGDNGVQLDLWVSSIDGRTYYRAFADFGSHKEVRWVDDELIEIWHSPDGLRICPERILTINPFTLASTVPPDLPKMGKSVCFRPLVASPDRSKIIYPSKDWIIYDLENRTSQIVFPWLEDLHPISLYGFSYAWTTRGLSFYFLTTHGVDVVFDLPITSIAETRNPMQSIELPNRVLNDLISWWSPEDGLLGIDLIDDDITLMDYLETTPPSQFYVLDARNLILRDYCLDRANLTEGSGRHYMAYASADSRFLAWTIYEPAGYGRALETVILDLDTGHISRIAGFDVIGWGVVPEASD